MTYIPDMPPEVVDAMSDGEVIEAFMDRLDRCSALERAMVLSRIIPKNVRDEWLRRDIAKWRAGLASIRVREPVQYTVVGGSDD